MDAIGINSDEEELISDSFVCCVCLELLYKPIVLSCGHISCFWCVHKSMSGVQDSHCPICRNPYHYFPTICQTLHFLLQKMYPLAYKRRELENLEEEKAIGTFSPQFEDANAGRSLARQGLRRCGESTCEDSSANSEQSEPISQEKTCVTTPEECQYTNNQVAGSFTDNDMNPSKDGPGGFCEQITVEDVPCSACKELLFRPVVLNCGHAYCESCLKHDEMIKCKVCQSFQPKGLPKVSLELAQFLEERFPKEYACRRDTAQLKQDNCKDANQHSQNVSRGLKVADKPAGNVPLLGNHESHVHFDCGCDFCGMYPIIGDRYRCKDCKEEIGFDLCGDCYKTNSKLPGRFNQQHTLEHKFELIKSNPFDRLFLRLRAAGYHVDSTALVISNYNSEEEPVDGSSPLSLTGSTQENVENSTAALDSSPGVEQDSDDSQPTT